MRIVTGHFGSHRGGSERALERLIAMWRDLGHEVECIVDPRRRALSLASELTAAARAFAPDMLFAGGQTYAPAFAIARRKPAMRRLPFAMKLSNAPLHPGKPVTTRLSQDWLRLQTRWTDCFVAPDAASAALLAGIGIPPRQTAAIPNPAASETHLLALHARSTVRRMPSSALHLLTVGRLVPQKNVALLIEAFSRIARTGDILTIVGEGPFRDRLERQAAGHAADIRLIGHQDDPSDRFAQANSFAIASDHEGLPAVLVEALAAGLPIAATDSAPGLADLVGKHGVLTPPRDPSALAAALDSLRGAVPDRQDMLVRALAFTAERSAPAYIDLFRRMIAA